MRTSRLAQETAKLAQAISPRSGTRRATRSSLAAATNDTPSTLTPSAHDLLSDDDSALSSTSSRTSPPPPPPATTPRKRKRGAEPKGTATTTVTTGTRVSPRKKGVKIEKEEAAELDIEDAVAGSLPHPRKAKRQPAKRVVDPATGDATVEAPPNWRAQYAAVQEMRRRHLAPVDTVGCERLADDDRPPKVQRYQHLTALMLSSQTKDTTTALAMNRLRKELPGGGLTAENVLRADPVRLNELIHAVGFHNNKTKYLQATAAILIKEHKGDISESAAELMKLPGVGPKMAHLCMSAAWGRTEGIGVDVHVHRITNLLGWHVTRTPEETRMSLEAWLPREKWHEINGLLVGFGQTICAPVGRRCGECVLSEQGICPSAVVERKKKAKRVKKEIVEEEGRENGVGEVVKDEVVEEVTVKEEEKTVEDVS